ncbi:hypothetical protein MMC29_008455, partial [Sticta canariensis]|nr:hypothetical protein [Sticta canariensis]
PIIIDDNDDADDRSRGARNARSPHAAAGDGGARGQDGVRELRARVSDQGRDCEFLAPQSSG